MLHFKPEARPYKARGATLPLPRSGLIATEAGKIDVFETGDRNGQAIVLVTHGLGSIESFEEIAEEMAARLPGRRIVTYSRPGRGRTPIQENGDVPDDLSGEALVVMPAILKALGIARADLVAHSDGAAVAMAYACAHPDMVHRIVALSPQVHADRRFIETTRNLPADERMLGISARLGAVHLDTGLAYRIWRNARETLCASPDALLDRLGRLRAPTLLVQGLRDEDGSSDQIAAMAARISGPVKWVLLRQDGHYPQHDNPGLVLDLIENHLAPPLARGQNRSAPLGQIALA